VIEVASAVVQVVTSGTDWPATAAAISGGVVGLAGIIFAWHQSGRTISAEDARQAGREAPDLRELPRRARRAYAGASQDHGS
jgi:hypothetical protein